MVYVNPDTPYMERLRPFLLKKHRLAADAWGADDSEVKHLYDPIVNHIVDAVPDEMKRKLYPPLWTLEDRGYTYSAYYVGCRVPGRRMGRDIPWVG